MAAATIVYRTAAVVLAISVFLPCVEITAGAMFGLFLGAMGGMGSVSASFWAAAQPWATIVLALVACAFVGDRVCKESFAVRVPLFCALAATAIVGFVFVRFLMRMDFGSKSNMTNEENYMSLAFAGDMQLQWGWVFLIGTCLTMVAAAIVELRSKARTAPSASLARSMF